MDKKKDYEIKVDGTPNTFKGGAIRYNKNKGRFDLIQEDVVIRLLRKIYNIESLVIANKGEILEDAFAGRYDDAIIKLSCWYYCEMTDETGAVFQGHEVMRYFIKMLPDLAILFQKGAQKYGERNCEAGIPLWSFRDSGLRHLTQYFNGIEDEPHYIHAIWNFCLADWTIHNHPERCYKPESKGEVNKDKTPEIPDEKYDDDVKYNESDAKVCEKQFKDEHKKRNDALSSLAYSLQYLLDSGKFKEVKLDELTGFKEGEINVNKFNRVANKDSKKGTIEDFDDETFNKATVALGREIINDCNNIIKKFRERNNESVDSDEVKSEPSVTVIGTSDDVDKIMGILGCDSKTEKVDDSEQKGQNPVTVKELIDTVYSCVGDSWVYCDNLMADFFNTEHAKSAISRTLTDFVLTIVGSKIYSVIDSFSDSIFKEAFDEIVFCKRIPPNYHTIFSEFIVYMSKCLNLNILRLICAPDAVTNEDYRLFRLDFQRVLWTKCIRPIFTNEKNFINMFPEIKEFSKTEYFDEKTFLSAVSKLCENNMNGCIVKLLGYNELKQLREYSRYSSSINESTDIESTENLIRAYNSFKKAQKFIRKFDDEEKMNTPPVMTVVKRRKQNN